LTVNKKYSIIFNTVLSGLNPHKSTGCTLKKLEIEEYYGN